MDKEEELKGKILRLTQEIERLRIENMELNQGMVKKKAEVAGEMTDVGIFEEEVKKINLKDGFDTEEVKLTTYFSIKGHQLEKGKVCRCSFCSIILTVFEKIEVNNRIYCEKCYREEEHDLDKNDYKVLICIFNNYTKTSTILEYLGFAVTIQRLTGITKKEVEKKIENLLGKGYLFLHGIFFRKLRVSSLGEEALTAYNQIYKDEDCINVKYNIYSRGF
jgi:hypothetical protein